MSTLHIVESLDRGAVENWLLRMLRHASIRGIDLEWTFYCLLNRTGQLDEEARALGARVILSPVPISRKLEFVKALRAELRAGQYDVMHCHHDLVSGMYLTAASGLPVRRHIVHIHNADEAIPVSSRVKQAILRPIMRRVCLSSADRIVGISNHTLDTFLGGRKRLNGRDVVHYYGVDPTPFGRTRADRVAFRRELGFTENAKLLLFAGRLVPEKSPLFAVDVLAEMRRLDPAVSGIFVGAGSLEKETYRRAAELNVGGFVRMLGWRSDIPAIMSCCDLFILPHPERPMEGFGLAVVEAQLAGLRLLISKGIADDPLLPTAVYRRLSLADPVQAWAEAATDMLAGPAPLSSEAIKALHASPMDMDRALAALLALYQ